MDPETHQFNWIDPLLLLAKANVEENPDYNQSMNGLNSGGYWDKM